MQLDAKIPSGPIQDKWDGIYGKASANGRPEPALVLKQYDYNFPRNSLQMVQFWTLPDRPDISARPQKLLQKRLLLQRQ